MFFDFRTPFVLVLKIGVYQTTRKTHQIFESVAFAARPPDTEIRMCGTRIYTLVAFLLDERKGYSNFLSPSAIFVAFCSKNGESDYFSFFSEFIAVIFNYIMIYFCIPVTEAIEELKERPLGLLLEDLGGWPVTRANWSEDNFDWVYQIAQLQLYSNNILISQWVGPDGKNSSMHIIQVFLNLFR